MTTNDPGREPEPTDAELRTLHELRECLAVWVSDAMVLGNIRAYDALCAVNAAIAAHRVAKAAFRAMDDAVESDGGARIDKEGWEPLCDAMDEYESRMNGFCTSGARPMPDTKLCGAVTQAGEDRKFRTCELPSGHEGRHESHLGGETVWWENTGPECEHGHLARVCVTCELIAAEARIADLERENAALGAELDKVRGVFRGAMVLPFRSNPRVNMDDDMVRVTTDMTKRTWFCIRPGAAGKEAPDAE